MDDDYRPLMEGAREALGALLEEMDVGEGILLRQAYRALGDDLKAAADRACLVEAMKAERRRYVAWHNLEEAVRNQWIFNAVGAGGVTSTVIARRIEQAHDCDAGGPLQTYLKRLVESGELTRERVVKIPGGTAWCWHYYRQTELSPEMKALQASLDATGG